MDADIDRAFLEMARQVAHSQLAIAELRAHLRAVLLSVAKVLPPDQSVGFVVQVESLRTQLLETEEYRETKRRFDVIDADFHARGENSKPS